MADTTAISWTESQMKWCTKCKSKHPITEFGKDKSRGDGLAARCLASSRTGKPRGWHGKPSINPLTGKPGPIPNPPRSGDKVQARQRINVEVRTGERQHPNKLPCADCGHIWKKGERRHEYDHHKGYESEHHYDVESLCTICHSKRDNPEATKKHCKHGHKYSEENTGRKANGTRYCKPCRRAYDRNRHDAEYWREYRKKRKENVN